MKKLLFLVLFMAVSFSAFATDTKLGNFKLTDKQMSQSENLKGDLIKGFTLWGDGTLFAVSERELTSQEKSDLISNIELLQDEWTPEAILSRFNSDLAISREAQSFDPEALVRLMPVSYSINELIKFKNFCGGVAEGVPYAGLKQIGGALVKGGQILQSDYDTLSKILLEQGVDLGACNG